MKLIPFRKNEKWGYSDKNKKILIPCQYDKATPFFEGRGVVSIADNSSLKSAVINEKGELLCGFLYDNISRFQEWRARVQKDGKWGVIDDKGNLIVPLIYDGISEYSCSRAVVNKDGILGFIDLDGDLVTGIEFEECTDFEEGYASVKKNGFYGAIDTDGKEIIPFISTIPVLFSEELAHISIPNEIGNLANTSKKQNRKEIYYGVVDFKGGNKSTRDLFDAKVWTPFNLEYPSGYVNTLNEVVIEMKYDMAFPFVDGIACVAIDSKFGFINPKGEFVISPIYEDAGDFNCGLAKVKKDGK